MTSLADLIPEPTFSPFKEVFDRAKSQAAAQGEARGEAHALLTVMTARRIPITASARRKINTCTDRGILSAWLRNAATATRTRDIFTPAGDR